MTTDPDPTQTGPLLPPVSELPRDPLVEATTAGVQQLFASALKAASGDIEKLFATNQGGVQMPALMRELTVGMVRLLEARVRAMAPADPSDPT